MSDSERIPPLDEAHLRLLSERWLQATWETDAHGAMTASSTWQRFTGQSPAELARYGWLEAVQAQDRAAVLESWHGALAAGTAFDAEFRVRLASGAWTWTNARALAIRAGDGTISKWVGVNIDVGPRRSSELAQRESEERYRLMVENALDYAIITIDANDLIVTWSPGAEVAFGRAAAHALRKPFGVVCRRVAAPAGSSRPERMATHPHAGKYAMPGWYQRRDGRAMFLEGTARVLPGAGPDGAHVLFIGKDVTAQHRVEEALYASEARYRHLIETVQDHSTFLTDDRGIITEWTAAAERVTGYVGSEVIGRHLSMLYPPEAIAAGAVKSELDEAAVAGSTERSGWRIRNGGHRIWMEEVTTAVRDPSGMLTGFSKVGRDVTVRRRTEEIAERNRKRIGRQRLRASLALAEEQERRRLARELHDTAGQHVTALSLGLGAVADLVAADAVASQRVDELRRLANTLGEELHDLAIRLRPRALDDFGLEAAISSAVAGWSRQYGIAIAVHVTTGSQRLPIVVENALYRIVQESLTNVARHSGAKNAGVLIERPDGHVMAIVEDDGCGFDPKTRDHGGLGLLGIYERSESLGGSVQIETAPGKGTTILVRIPLPE